VKTFFLKSFSAVTLVTVLAPFEAAAEVHLNPLFADNAVLQRDAEVPVWGTARDGELVTVEIQGQKVSTTAVAGKWMVRLKPLKAGVAFNLMVKADNEITLTNILVGEVWLCSGQSNMEWALARSDGGLEAIANSANPLLRMCRVPHNVQSAPQSEVNAKWELCSPATAKNFSAIPYWFGEKLQKESGVPVGIINSAFGGTPIQSWLPAETLINGPWPQDKWNDPAQAKADYDKKIEAVRPLKEKYEAEKAEAIAKQLPVPPPPAGIPSEFKGATTLWNGEVAPLLPYRIRGVAWYQGENNAYVQIAHDYKNLLPAMIKDWRKGFAQPDLPFLIFQIARNRKWQTDPNEKSGIAELQEAQAKVAQATPRAALVVSTDKGGPDVHYTGKEPVAERGVNAALAIAYEKKIQFSGPVYRSAKFENGKAVVRFTETAGGLKTNGGELTGFVIAGADKIFCFADAKIDGDAIVVSSPQVSKPVAVRYGWADLPKVNLFNKAGLPASTFRTDDWPL
jgi:sialate O-acetylesterase